jgi:hypothetical protein
MFRRPRGNAYDCRIDVSAAVFGKNDPVGSEKQCGPKHSTQVLGIRNAIYDQEQRRPLDPVQQFTEGKIGKIADEGEDPLVILPSA